jgi:ubiquitin-protein ligase
MATLQNANPNNFAVKRIMKEFAEFQKEPEQYFVANPLEVTKTQTIQTTRTTRTKQTMNKEKYKQLTIHVGVN